MRKVTFEGRIEELRSVANLAIVLNILNVIIFLTFLIGEMKIARVIYSFFAVLGMLALWIYMRNFLHPKSSQIKIISLQQVAIFAIVCFQLSYILKFQDWSWDGLWYHSPAARIWSRELDFTNLYPSSFANSYPGSTATFQAIIWHFMPNAPSQIGNFLLFLVILILIRKLLLGLGMPSKIAESALLVFTITPTVFSQSMTSYNDVIFGAIAFVSISLGVKYYEYGDKNLLFGALSLSSLAASVKYQGVVLFAFTLAFLFFRLKSTHKEIGNFPTKQETTFGFNGILALVAILLAGFIWEIKNWFNYGNPLYPFDFGVGPLVLVRGPLGSPNSAFLNNESALAGFQNSPLSFIQAAWHFTPNFTYDARQGGFGILWPFILLAAFVFLLKVRGSFQIILLASLLFTLITPANWWPRYQIHLFLAAITICFHMFSGKSKFRDLSRKLVISASVIQLLIYIPFVGPYPNFFPQPTNVESFKTPWENQEFTEELFSIPTNGQMPIAPELSVISKSEGKDIAFWWIEPLILPLLGTGDGNRITEITGTRNGIKKQIEKIRPKYFVTRQDLTKVEVPPECALKEVGVTGIYNAKIFECDWRLR